MPNRLDKQTAISRLTARWQEETLRYPLMARDIPLSVYIAANLRHVRKMCLLSSYDMQSKGGK